MSLTVLEINDAALSVVRDGVTLCTSPGVALVEAGGVLTGAAAQARAQLQPREVYAHFWQQLNLQPLANATPQARHHADLAWHHLRAVLDAAGRPAEAVLAVPGDYDDATLGLLLGLCASLDLAVGGLVDSAVAAIAGCAPAGRYVVVDLHRHRAVLTTVEVGDSVTRLAVSDVQQAGLARIEAAAADLAAGALLAQARFDALHEAASAQRLHDAVPGWLALACTSAEVPLSLEFRGRQYSARVPAREFVHVTGMVLAAIAERLPGAGQVVASASLAALPGALEHLAPARALPAAASYRGVAEHRLALGASAGGVPFVTTLPRARAPALAALDDDAPRARRGRAPSHVLCGAEARALGAAALYLHADGRVAHEARGPAAALTLAAGGALLSSHGVEARVNGVAVGGNARVEAGDHITLASGRALYIPIIVPDERAP